jgi:hypothetical protein
LNGFFSSTSTASILVLTLLISAANFSNVFLKHKKKGGVKFSEFWGEFFSSICKNGRAMPAMQQTFKQ